MLQREDYSIASVRPGESALHVAIVHGDTEMVKFLVEKEADVNQRATGRFFMPEDQKTGKKKATNYIGEFITASVCVNGSLGYTGILKNGNSVYSVKDMHC